MDAKTAKAKSEKNQIPYITSLIEKAANAGRRKIYLYDTISPENEVQIKDFGYTLEFNDEINRYEISW